MSLVGAVGRPAGHKETRRPVNLLLIMFLYQSGIFGQFPQSAAVR
jgi:hypothetical protein